MKNVTLFVCTIVFGICLLVTYVLPPYVYSDFDYQPLWVGIQANWLNYGWMILSAIAFVIFYFIVLFEKELEDIYHWGYGLVIGGSIPWIFFTIEALRSTGMKKTIFKWLTMLCLGVVSIGSILLNVAIYKDIGGESKMWLAFWMSIIFSIQTVILDFLYWGYFFIKK